VHHKPSGTTDVSNRNLKGVSGTVNALFSKPRLYSNARGALQVDTTQTHAHTTQIHAHVHTQTYTHTCTHTHMHDHTHTHTHDNCTHALRHTTAHACTHEHTHTHTHLHMHTHKHTQTRTHKLNVKAYIWSTLRAFRDTRNVASYFEKCATWCQETASHTYGIPECLRCTPS
jgi:hypothetical protein